MTVSDELDDNVAAYSILGAAKKLSVSERTIYRALENKTIRSFKVNNLRRIPASELEKLIGSANYDY